MLDSLKRRYISSDFDDMQVSARIQNGEVPFLVSIAEPSGVKELTVILAKSSAQAVIEVAGMIFDNEHSPRGFKVEVKRLFV